MGQKIAGKFISRILFGTVIAVILGNFLDKILHTKPIIVILMIVYVVVGSLILLIKDAEIKKH